MLLPLKEKAKMSALNFYNNLVITSTIGGSTSSNNKARKKLSRKMFLILFVKTQKFFQEIGFHSEENFVCVAIGGSEPTKNIVAVK